MTKHENCADRENEYQGTDFRKPVNALLAGLVIAGLVISMTFSLLNPGQLSLFFNIAPITLAILSFFYLGFRDVAETMVFGYFIATSLATVLFLFVPIIPASEPDGIVVVLSLHVLLILFFRLYLRLRSRSSESYSVELAHYWPKHPARAKLLASHSR